MKSHEKISLELLQVLYQDLCRECDAAVDQRDLERLRLRTEHEGYGFLSIALPAFGSSVQDGLEQGFIETASFAGFRKKGKVPRLFGVFLSRVFSPTGELLPEPDPKSVWALRQLSFAFKKKKELCNETKVSKALSEFEEVEQELADFQVGSDDFADFCKVSRLIWDGVLANIKVFDTIPGHGPGATAEGITGNSKFVLKRWHDRLENYFPLLSFGYGTINAYESEYFDSCESVEEELESPVRVIAVPKTAKAPRLIAIEPVCMQYCQHALADPIMRAIENSNMTAGHVNFTDQTVNQKLALQSSIDRHYSTLDLSQASDRVLREFVEPMFACNPDLLGAIMACRSNRADLNGKILSLRKFASMGSALCFPIESMFFYTLCILGQLRSTNLPIEYDSIKMLARSTYVYGDDIIIPTEHASWVSRTLTSFACKVNSTKSFSKGFFRESCGMDAFLGMDVTPVYFRKNLPRTKKDIPELLSSIATSNLFYKNGLWLTATMIQKIIEKVVGKLPIVGDTFSGIGLESITFRPPYNENRNPTRNCRINGTRVRWSKTLHRYETHAYVSEPLKKKDQIDSYPALCRFFTSPLEGDPVERDNEYSQRRGASTLKRRWLALC